MKFKLAMFDWNGTLLDDLKIAYEGVRAIFRNFGLEPPRLKEYRDNIPADVINFYRQRGVPTSWSLADLHKIWKPVVEKRWDEAKLTMYAPFILRHCKNMGMARVLITMENAEIISRRLEQFGLADQFNDIISRNDAIPRALDKVAAMRAMLAKFGVENPKQAFYIGDTIGDIDAGKVAGVTTIAYTGGYNSRKKLKTAKPDYIVRSLFELFLILINYN